MPIDNIKIFPSIGIARLGNSPTDFFIGPEIPGVIPKPPGGYKDNQCRIKRQAARFRLFAYDGNTLVQEITSSDATISWSVHLVHGKSANYSNDSSRKIDPGVRTITGALQQAKFNTGTFGYGPHTPVSVELGEIRTDDQGRLLVLGGFGNSGTADPTQATTITNFRINTAWYDDASDGSVNATVIINGNSIPVLGAWVVVGPPDFAPDIGNAISLYDRLKQYHADNGLLPSGFPLPTDASYQPSFNDDIYPLLKRGWEDVQEVLDVASPITLNYNTLSDNTGASQAARTAAIQHLRRNGGVVPRSSTEAQFDDLTPLQFAMLQKWEAGNFINDWTGAFIPGNSISPQGLVKASLDNSTGAVFFPGIEAGEQLVTSPNRYVSGELFRIDHSVVSPGEITKDMAVPWQADFYACNATASTCTLWTDTAWWPTQRPINALDANSNVKINWKGGVNGFLSMVNNWHTLGFVVKVQGQFQDSERCDTASITLLTPSINFGAVPLGPGGLPRPVARAIVFEVISPSSSLNFSITSPPPPVNVQALNPGPFSIGPTASNSSEQLLIPIRYVATSAGSSVNTSITIHNSDTGRTWVIPISASTSASIKNAVSLVLDRSGSMNQDRGDGLPKIQSLRESVRTFVDLMAAGDATSLVRYNQDAQEILGMTTVGPSDPLDAPRNTVKSAVGGADFNPSGFTSIGDGIIKGRDSLNNASGFDTKSMVILTDGKENRSAYIEDVANQINERTYAIGLGMPSNINVATLQSITGNNGGYLLITGAALTGNNQFRLQKHFMQILTGINNKEIIYDPDGLVHPGQTHRIPFLISDAEIGVDVILVSSNTKHVELSLQGPSGRVYDANQLVALANLNYFVSSGVKYYRFSLPLEVAQNRYEFIGQWQALVHYPDNIAHGGRPIPYSLNVHAYSSLQFRLTGNVCKENDNVFILDGSLNQYDSIPIANATVWAEIQTPSGLTTTLSLSDNKLGRFELKYQSCSPGLYNIRVLARGKTLKGVEFQREKTLSFPVISGPEFSDRGSTWENQIPDPDGDYLVYGTITDGDNKPISGLRVRAVDQDFTGENPLGKETQTDIEGKYRIPYSAQDFIIDGKETGGADIILYIYDNQDELLHRSEPRRGSPKIKEINLSIQKYKK
ncbi:MAG: LodA/GoxA family CTQ-dependent oxidase [Bacteroidota bacterium]